MNMSGNQHSDTFLTQLSSPVQHMTQITDTQLYQASSYVNSQLFYNNTSLYQEADSSIFPKYEYQIKEENNADMSYIAPTSTSLFSPNFNFEISTSPSMMSKIEEKIEEKAEFVDEIFSQKVQVKQENDNECYTQSSGLFQRSKKIYKIEVCKKRDNADKFVLKEKVKRFRSRKSVWTQEEDARLRALVEKHGQRWSTIACAMGTKTGKQVRDRYNNYIGPDINYQEWTEEEDQLFIDLLARFGKKWCLIASEMPGRTENQVKNRFYSVLRARKAKEKRLELTSAIQEYQNREAQLKFSLDLCHSEYNCAESEDIYKDLSCEIRINLKEEDIFKVEDHICKNED